MICSCLCYIPNHSCVCGCIKVLIDAFTCSIVVMTRARVIAPGPSSRSTIFIIIIMLLSQNLTFQSYYSVCVCLCLCDITNFCFDASTVQFSEKANNTRVYTQVYTHAAVHADLHRYTLPACSFGLFTERHCTSSA